MLGYLVDWNFAFDLGGLRYAARPTSARMAAPQMQTRTLNIGAILGQVPVTRRPAPSGEDTLESGLLGEPHMAAENQANALGPV